MVWAIPLLFARRTSSVFFEDRGGEGAVADPRTADRQADPDLYPEEAPAPAPAPSSGAVGRSDIGQADMAMLKARAQ